MRPPGTFHLVSPDLLRPGPTLGGTKHDHGPARPEGVVRFARRFLLVADLADRFLQCGGHFLMHRRRIAPFHEIGLVAVADKQRFQLFVADARKDRWVGDLVAIQIQDRQHRAVAHWVDKLVGMPRCSERPGLRLAVTHDAGDDEIGVVERHAVSVGETVTQLAAFVDGARGFRSDVAPDMAGEGKLLEELLHPFRVLTLVGIDLGVGAFEIRRPQHPGRAMAWPGHENHVEVVLDDHPVEMYPNERQRRARAPVAEQPVLHIFSLQGLLEQRVILEINHSHRKVIACPPIGVHQFQLFIG